MDEADDAVDDAGSSTRLGGGAPASVKGLSLALAIGAWSAIVALMLTYLFLSAPVVAAAAGVKALPADCPAYDVYASAVHAPPSAGRYALGYQRPMAACRTSSFAEVEETIDDMKGLIKDPDLARLFENTFPNTLDTTISWHGIADGTSDEEASFRETPFGTTFFQ
jgi:Metal-independent alpha-mannosidase (GH125)